MPIGELEDKEARKRRLANWAEDERRKSLGDLEKSKKMKLIKQQLLAKKMKLLKQIKGTVNFKFDTIFWSALDFFYF